MEVFDENDLILVDAIAKHRHEIAHELPILITESGFEVRLHLFQSIYELIDKADNFWIMGEIPAHLLPTDGDLPSSRLSMLSIIAEAVSDYGINLNWPTSGALH